MVFLKVVLVGLASPRGLTVQCFPQEYFSPTPPFHFRCVGPYMGQKRRKCPKKACLEFVAAPQPARAARKHRSRVGGTPWHPGSAANRPDRSGSTPRSLWGCNKLAAERATDGVLAEVMECET